MLIVRIHGFHRVDGKDALVRHKIREVGKLYRGGNTALIFILSKKQIQKGSLTTPVPSSESQFPVRINLETDILKNILIAAVIGKGQIGNLNQRHSALPKNKMAAGSIPAAK